MDMFVQLSVWFHGIHKDNFSFAFTDVTGECMWWLSQTSGLLVVKAYSSAYTYLFCLRHTPQDHKYQLNKIINAYN
jgi:hypothetical protein